jgi:Domain of unknown function (DUF4124)
MRLLPAQSRPKGLLRAVQGGVAAAGVGLACLVAVGSAQAGIYTCKDPNGKRLTSDRPIPECLDSEQRVLNKDGSQKQVLPPRMTAAERAMYEAELKKREKAEQAYKDAVRRDRNLAGRYPNEALHRKAREAALDDVRKSIASSEARLAELAKERKPLLADAEFYKGKPLPFKLKSSLDANEAQQQAQHDIIDTQKAEMVRVNSMYDIELTRLKKLWAGAEPAFDAPLPPSMKAR